VVDVVAAAIAGSSSSCRCSRAAAAADGARIPSEAAGDAPGPMEQQVTGQLDAWSSSSAASAVATGTATVLLLLFVLKCRKKKREYDRREACLVKQSRGEKERTARTESAVLLHDENRIGSAVLLVVDLAGWLADWLAGRPAVHP